MTHLPGVGAISPGQNLSMQQTATAPDLTIIPADASASHTANFTLVTDCVDVYLVNTSEFGGKVLYWLVNYCMWP
jgi:hypothetical protein